jgi:hypothetical protein
VHECIVHECIVYAMVELVAVCGAGSAEVLGHSSFSLRTAFLLQCAVCSSGQPAVRLLAMCAPGWCRCSGARAAGAGGPFTLSPGQGWAHTSSVLDWLDLSAAVGPPPNA